MQVPIRFKTLFLLVFIIGATVISIGAPRADTADNIAKARSELHAIEQRIPVIQAQIATCHEEVSTQKQRLASLKSYQQSLWGGKVVVPIGGAPEEVGGKAVMLMNAKEAYEGVVTVTRLLS